MFKRKTEVIENKYFSLMGTVDPFQLEKKKSENFWNCNTYGLIFSYIYIYMNDYTYIFPFASGIRFQYLILNID